MLKFLRLRYMVLWPVLMKFKQNIRREKYVSVCSDSQAALRTIQTAKMTSPLI
jgi:hypothetical protein